MIGRHDSHVVTLSCRPQLDSFKQYCSHSPKPHPPMAGRFAAGRCHAGRAGTDARQFLPRARGWIGRDSDHFENGFADRERGRGRRANGASFLSVLFCVSVLVFVCLSLCLWVFCVRGKIGLWKLRFEFGGWGWELAMNLVEWRQNSLATWNNIFWFFISSVFICFLESSLDSQENAFGIDRNDIIRISAKTGVGVAEIFPAIVRRIKPPPRNLATVRICVCVWKYLFNSPVVSNPSHCCNAIEECKVIGEDVSFSHFLLLHYPTPS